MAAFRVTDLPDGDDRFVVPSATHRSWVYVRGVDDATELTGASMDRAPGAPMSDLHLTGQEAALLCLGSHAQAPYPPTFLRRTQ
jgi:hypothetical protein